MLFDAVSLDADMPVSAVLERMARYGLWLKPEDAAAKAWIDAQAKLFNEDLATAAKRLARDPKQFGVAIRRQILANVLWYALPADAVLRGCAEAASNITLLQALTLREGDSLPPVRLTPKGMPTAEGVVLDGDRPVAVSLGPVDAGGGGRFKELDSSQLVTGKGTKGFAGPRTRSGLWPRLNAPQYVPASEEFKLIVGLSETKQKGTAASDALTLTAPAGSNIVDLTVELTADGIDAPDGWSKDLHVSLNDPTAAYVTFRLIGQPPQNSRGDPHLTSLEVRFVSGGSVLGTASRPLIIGQPGSGPVQAISLGNAWLNQPEVHTRVASTPMDQPADLTIELTKPDRNHATGKYVCRLYSPHKITAGKGPYQINLGTDAKSFVSQYVENLQRFNTGALADNALRSLGDLVARQLPAPAFQALTEVAAKVAPEPPTVLIVSAEPYVPWELASFIGHHPLLYPNRPPYLGAQAVVGRWLRDPAAASGGNVGTAKGGASVPAIIERPPAQPPDSIEVRLMAVMAGLYKQEESGLKPLPGAIQEAAEIASSCKALELSATAQGLAQLLNRKLQQNFMSVGGADAFHFAGHGYFDQTRNDSAIMYLSDGTPVSSMLFRSAQYGGTQQPLFFLNACMIGTGGELLNDMGGFPGNCLRGGFGGLVGAFWVVDDIAARDVAIEFWSRALTGPSPEPVARILWDIRSKYDPQNSAQATYLAYVFYGHPRLALRRPVDAAPADPAIRAAHPTVPVTA